MDILPTGTFHFHVFVCPEPMTLFPFEQYWGFYAAFSVLILGLLSLDLFVFHRRAHAVSMKEAAGWSVFWVALGLAFGVGLYYYSLSSFAGNPAMAGMNHAAMAGQATIEYYTGFVIEKALAVDNLFVFVMIFAYLSIPAEFSTAYSSLASSERSCSVRSSSRLERCSSSFTGW